MKDVWKHMDKTLMNGLTFVVALSIQVGIVITGVEKQLPIWWLYIIIILSYFVHVIVYAVFTGTKPETIYRLPKVISIIPPSDDRKCITFLAEKNELFSRGALVTIYHQRSDDELETILGLGVVENITEKGMLQVVFYIIMDDAQSTIGNLKNTSSDVKAIKIKPTIDKDYFQGNYPVDLGTPNFQRVLVRADSGIRKPLSFIKQGVVRGRSLRLPGQHDNSNFPRRN